MHWLFTHFDLALGMLHCWQVQLEFWQMRPCWQTLPQVPQFLASVPVATSQPSLAVALQSEKPWSHEVSWQAALTHRTLAWAGAPHALPQAPQFFGSASTGNSQP